MSCKAQIASLITNKVPVKVFEKYEEYIDVFSKEVAADLLEYIRINDPPIDLKKDKQLFYKLIYRLGLVKLETLKTYITNNLKNSFIRLSKSPIRVPILFIKKADGFPPLCLN